MQQKCANSWCNAAFTVTEEEVRFLAMIGRDIGSTRITFPPPTLCPTCRSQRRKAWNNEGYLYHNTCARTGKPVISQLPPANPRPVWNIRDWWSDALDPLQYGRAFDPSRSFIAQFHELELIVPHPCVNTDLENINSDYTHHAGHEKNCYLMFHTSYAEDCYYGYGVKKSKNCMDCYYCHESELCYECIDIKASYNLAWCQDCQNCSDSRFLRDCAGCRHCTLCTGLRNVEYCVRNQQLSKTEYEAATTALPFHSFATVMRCAEELRTLERHHTWRCTNSEMTENSTGNYIYRSKDSFDCYDCSDIESCRNCTQLQLGAKQCQDVSQFGIGIELCHECAMIGYNIYDCHYCYDLLEQCSDLLYCISCFASKHCFGCFGLRHNEYCILNQQYSREEYERLVPQIIEHMQRDSSWGEFFPAALSQSAYNDTTAQLWYPITQKQAHARGWEWREDEANDQYMGPVFEIPDSLLDVDDAICTKILRCAVSGKPFKIIPQELAFYRSMSLPLPRISFPERHRIRFSRRLPRMLFRRPCMKCGKAMETSYAPERTEIVYCERCYLASVY